MLDEPTASLDFGNQGKVLREIRGLAESGHGVLFTTHDPNHARRAADRGLFLRDGHSLAEGRVGDVLTRDALQTLYRTRIRRIFDPEFAQDVFLPDGRRSPPPEETRARSGHLFTAGGTCAAQRLCMRASTRLARGFRSAERRIPAASSALCG